MSDNLNASCLLEKNMDKINWIVLSRNPNAIKLLEKNVDKINWECLIRNPSIFGYNYNKIRHYYRDINLGIIQERFHPRNLNKFKTWGIEEFEDWEDDAFL